MHVYEIRPRKDHRGVDLISDALPFGSVFYFCCSRVYKRCELLGILADFRLS